MFYTCKKCDTKQSRTFSKTSYHQGVVIIRCEGCQNLHLIADNLGWFEEGKVNIEDLISRNNEQVLKIKTDGELQRKLLGMIKHRNDPKSKKEESKQQETIGQLEDNNK